MLLLPDLRVRQREYLLQISRAMTAQLDLVEVLRLILKASVTMLAGEVGLIAMREADGGLRVRALFGVAAEYASVFDTLLSNYNIPDAGNFEVEQFEHDLRQASRSLGLSLKQAVALPMYFADDFIGMIYVFRNFTGTASLNDRTVLQSFADQAAIAVYNARLYETMNHERKRLASILEYTADGVMILDDNRNIVRFNKAMSRMSGLQLDDVIGKCYDNVIIWASRTQGKDLGEAIADGWPDEMADSGEPLDTLYMEGDMRRPDGTTISVGITFAPLFDAVGHLLNIIVNVRDITHFRKLQEMQSTFISVVSHELKTPVALIKGYAGTLRREDASWDHDVLEQSLAVIEEEADRLAEQIENLLAASKLQAEGMRLNYEDVSLYELVSMAVPRFSTQTKNHKLIVNFPETFPTVPGDYKRLRQVLDNLLSNAIKYSPKGGQITITGSYDGETVKLSVQDEGIGLPQDEWDRIFDRFYRAHDTRSQTIKGTGLGLYLSRAVINAHGGQIGVTSKPGHGSTFYFSLPRHQ